jgi:calcium permeable stress-gated cation channel
LSSRVVLFLFAPKEALREDNLQDTFGSEAQKSWIVSDQSKLENFVTERNDRAMKLEGAEVQLIREANKKMLQRKNSGSASEIGDTADVKVPYRSRPKHRLTPLIGTKVDTIDWARKTLPNLQNRVEKHRETSETSAQPKTSAVFVAFSSPAAAQRAYLEVTFHPIVARLTPDRLLGVQPKEALWTNLTLAPSNRIPRVSLATALVIATILFWSIPIGFVGAISNIKYLTDNVKFLRFLNNLPPAIIGLISGLLPPLAISTLVSYIPKIFRCVCLRSPFLQPG